MNSQSVNSLVATIRTRADMIGSTTFSDTVELVPWVRASLAQLTEILDSRWIDWHTVARPLSLLADVERYSLPSDFRSMQAVYMMYQGGKYRRKLNNFTREEYGGGSTASPAWPIKYGIQGGRIVFTPRPSQDALNAIEFLYTPHWTGPVLDWTPIDLVLPNGWDEWVVLDVIQKMRTKTNLDIRDTVAAKMEVLNRVVAAASKRSGDPPVMRDVYQSASSPWYNSNPSGQTIWTGY